jgi:hypothetical protein
MKWYLHVFNDPRYPVLPRVFGLLLSLQPLQFIMVRFAKCLAGRVVDAARIVLVGYAEASKLASNHVCIAPTLEARLNSAHFSF